MGDQHVRAVVVGQGGDRFRILGQTRLRTGIVLELGRSTPPRDSSLVQLNSDVAPAPRATHAPCTRMYVGELTSSSFPTGE